MDSPSPVHGEAPQKTRTIAFRLTSSQRASIDLLARADGISTSEYTRRAVFESLRPSLSALEEATERGRQALRPTIDKLERDLARYRQANTQWEEFVGILQRDLKVARAADLVDAVRQLLAGSPRARESVAICWSHLSDGRRRVYLPIAAAVVTDHMDQSFAALPISERSIDEQVALVGRIHWLSEALKLDSEPLSQRSQSQQPASIGPVWAAHLAAAQELGRRIEGFEECQLVRSAREVVAADASSRRPSMAPVAAAVSPA